MARSRLRSLGELARSLRGSLPVPDPAPGLQSAFRLPPGSLMVFLRGDTAHMVSADKTVRFALKGLDREVLSWLREHGHAEIRRISWPAE